MHTGDEFLQRFLGIAKLEIDTLVAAVERILHTSITGLQVVVADDHLGCLVHIQHGHAIDRRSLSLAGSRVQHVVGTNHHYGIGLAEVVVDLLHLEQFLVRHIGLSQQHVHVARHTTCHGMDGEAHAGTTVFEGLSQLLHLMLGLCQSHTVARYDDDVLGLCQHGSG